MVLDTSNYARLKIDTHSLNDFVKREKVAVALLSSIVLPLFILQLLEGLFYF